MKYIYIPIYARNAVLSKNTINILTELKALAANEIVKKWVANKFKKYLIEEYGQQIYQSQENDATWIKEALANGEHVYFVDISEEDYVTYSNCIAFLNTLPQAKIKGLPVLDALKEYQKAERKKNADEIEGVKTVYKFDNGFRVVELSTEAALKKESKRMSHCLDKPEYWEKVQAGEERHYSLRDIKNKPHITIHFRVKENRVIQIKGYKNKVPNKKLFSFLIEFLDNLHANYECSDFNNLCVTKVNGKWVDLEDVIYNNQISLLVLPEAFAKNHPCIGDIRIKDNFISNHVTGESISSVSCKTRIAFRYSQFSYIGSLTSPSIVLISSNIQKIDSLKAKDIIIKEGGNYDIINSISCNNLLVLEGLHIGKIKHITGDSFGIANSEITSIDLSNMGYVSIKYSNVGITSNNIKLYSIENSNISLSDSNIDSINLKACTIRLKNTSCNRIDVAEIKNTNLILHGKSYIDQLCISEKMDNQFLANIKKYKSKIGCISSFLENKEAILNAGFKFITLKHSIFSSTDVTVQDKIKRLEYLEQESKIWSVLVGSDIKNLRLLPTA